MNAMMPLLSDAPRGEVTETDGRLQVVFRRHYRKPVAKVWAALTTPERLADWFGKAEIDLRPGGTLKLMFENGAAMHLAIKEVVPPRLFSWTWELDGRETLVTFEIEPDGDGSNLTLTHSGLSPRKGSGAGVRAGWHAHLEGFAESLEGKATPWEVKAQREQALSSLYPPLPA